MLKTRAGFTLTEIAIVLAVVGAIVAAIWTAASVVSRNNQVNHAAQELHTIVQNVFSLQQTYFSAADRANGNLTTKFINAGAFPEEMLSPTVTNCIAGALPVNVINPWGGCLSIYNESLTGSILRLSLYSVPEYACIALLLQMTNCDPAQRNCPVSVMTDLATQFGAPTGAPLSWQNNWTVGGVASPMDPVSAATALCKKNAPPNTSPYNNTVEFNYQL